MAWAERRAIREDGGGVGFRGMGIVNVEEGFGGGGRMLPRLGFVSEGILGECRLDLQCGLVWAAAAGTSAGDAFFFAGQTSK